MRCSGCGKDIPFNGSVCPYCQRDKSGDQAFTTITFVGLLVGAGLGYAMGGVMGAIIGAIVGGFIAIFPGLALKKQSQPPEVRITQPYVAPLDLAPPTQSAYPAPNTDVENQEDIEVAHVPIYQMPPWIPSIEETDQIAVIRRLTYIRSMRAINEEEFQILMNNNLNTAA